LAQRRPQDLELLGPLEEYGVDEVEGLLDLDPEDVDALVYVW
jgi:hypothetical protein